MKAIADNLGVISRARTPLTPLKMNQSQADALSLMKNIISDLPIHIAFIHVNSHLDDHVEYDQLPFDNQQNSDVDALAHKEHSTKRSTLAILSSPIFHINESRSTARGRRSHLTIRRQYTFSGGDNQLGT